MLGLGLGLGLGLDITFQMRVDFGSGLKFNFLGQSELHYVIRLWTQEHENFKGGFKIKMSIMGLLKLFYSNNASFANMTVRGDLRVDLNQGLKP